MRESGRGQLPPEDAALFCGQIAMLLRSGVALPDGMDALCETYKGLPCGEVFARLSERVKETGSLSESLDKEGDAFPAYLRGMFRVGEKAGLMEETADALENYYEREAQIRKAIKSAVVYPLLLTLMMAAVIAVLTVRVLPIFNQVFDSLGAEASGAAKTIMRVGSGVGTAALIATLLLALLSLVVFILMHTGAKEKTSAFLLRLFPPARKVSEQLSASRLAGVLSRLLRSGYPAEDALTLSGELIEDRKAAQRVAQCAENMESGMGVADALKACGVFSDLHNRMIAVGAASGQLDTVLQKLSDIYDQEADDGIRRLVGLIEPALVALLSIVIGAILLAVMLPLASILASMG